VTRLIIVVIKYKYIIYVFQIKVVKKETEATSSKKFTANKKLESAEINSFDFLDNMSTTSKKALADLLRLAKASNKMIGVHASMAGC
jgi:hypothetical protein